MLLISFLIHLLFTLLQCYAVEDKHPTIRDVDFRKIHSPDPPVTHHVLMGIVYYDSTESKYTVTELIMDLYGTTAPYAVENFVALARGFKVSMDPKSPQDTIDLGYKRSLIDRIFPNDRIIGGDVLPGLAPYSVFGPNFADEPFFLKHDRPGRLSLLNKGEPDSNDSNFFITMKPEGSPEYDDKHVVFGQIIMGLDNLLERIQNVKINDEGVPAKKVAISHMIVDEVEIPDKDEKHREYLERLAKFNEGDLSVGTALVPTATQMRDAKNLEDESFALLNHPATSVSIGIIGLLLCYALMKFRRQLLIHSKKIVSFRND
ncbi:hypothetical protein KAFR_0C04560 [Kazachstania africana CBS 2517]|uniref:PPIase cyclophilin-type domain-containing protein n=1 Tax=Kazachstania africana (strain ATCC 22294 / BCRC 22015 / CBS 2517 / CECT 1963 / NBRC 1671 / NRRL Y-8276) TaxID=1071382 RepID=H2ASU7_KAZAF|nr:hypothetical protein KAFR_0C04560 [Kazachstania africana CBS 2517]CCF57447.1 hypothetical protein KAFR_0C04560 [Kazachstania africana CBS 2517]